MSDIKEITRYLTSDGVEYTDEEKALERQAVINFKWWYNTLKGGEVLKPTGYLEEDTVEAKVLSTWILKNKEAVLTLLGYEDMV